MLSLRRALTLTVGLCLGPLAAPFSPLSRLPRRAPRIQATPEPDASPGNATKGGELDWDSAWQAFQRDPETPAGAPAASSSDENETVVALPKFPPPPRELTPYPKANPPKPPYSRPGPGRVVGRAPEEATASEAFMFRRPAPSRVKGEGPEFNAVSIVDGGNIFLVGLGVVGLLLSAAIFIFVTGGITDSASRAGNRLQEDVPSYVEDNVV